MSSPDLRSGSVWVPFCQEKGTSPSGGQEKRDISTNFSIWVGGYNTNVIKLNAVNGILSKDKYFIRKLTLFPI
ncbi:hypothetical protein SAMN04488023_101111 [Pedobacter rhizosphaerae]|uniref:Uncharacterized protein n=1 Tax=Pedobacter rhizosphaerae TaxID=390241 RepID=A0A1H9IWE2_9SPHI|nr:hypothetical protein SAMN04488023_101111 [Pedobacter rhizosphaerae]